MSEWFQRNGWTELAALSVVGILAAIVRLAADPPRSLARMAWLTIAGLGLSTGGWLVAKAAGIEGYGAMAIAWVVGAMGSEATLPLARRWLESRLGVPPERPPPGA